MTQDPRDTVIALLQLAQAYDSRNIDGLMVDAWLDSARRAHWTAETSADAIRSHYAESTDRIMPGHITARVKAATKGPGYAPEYRPELPAAPPASEEGRAAARALFESATRTHEPRKPLPRRRRVSDGSDGPESGPDPVRAFSSNLGGLLGWSRSNGGE
ncbi:MAG: hypothetical protein JWN03_7399 [Nocardia sp.]|uniref:hypothetical protein n=1 Tax=Nocardia sp. TaxID=1821 RepID=UPI002603AC1E|nr:hypothetical protein [Nocardia sp.]MCU1647124.1 hypothetical protein [Nocardia sp.]